MHLEKFFTIKDKSQKANHTTIADSMMPI